jgi:hypothetical protein
VPGKRRLLPAAAASAATADADDTRGLYFSIWLAGGTGETSTSGKSKDVRRPEFHFA